LEFAWCVRGSAAAGLSAPAIHTSMTHGRGVITRSSPVSSLLRRPRASKDSGDGCPSRLQPTSSKAFHSASAFGGCVAARGWALSVRTFPNPRPLDASDLWRLCHDAAAPRRNPVRLEAPSPRCGSLLFPERSFAQGSTSKTSPHHRVLRLWPSPGKGRALESLQHQRLLRVDLAARARECSVARLHEALRSRSGFAPATSRPFGSRTCSRSFFDLEVDRVPARSYRRSLLTTSLVLEIPAS